MCIMVNTNSGTQNMKDYGAEISQLANNAKFLNISAVSNTYTLDLSTTCNFAITTADTVAKAVAVSNIPSTANTVTSMVIKLKYTNAAAITWFSGITWQNAITPSFVAGKTYYAMFETWDNGTTWLGSVAGAW